MLGSCSQIMGGASGPFKEDPVHCPRQARPVRILRQHVIVAHRKLCDTISAQKP